MQDISNLHCCVRSFPQQPGRNELETFPICQEQKLHRSLLNPDNPTQTATLPYYQGLSIDFGFTIQKNSADSEQVQRLQGLNAKTCYCLIADDAQPATFMVNALLAKRRPSSTLMCG